MIKTLRNCLILTSLSSCAAIWDPMPDGWDWGIQPRPAVGIRNFPATDTEYGKGFKDGCTVAWNAITKGIIGDILTSTYNYDRMKKNIDYNTGWWDGFEQCTYINDWDVV